MKVLDVLNSPWAIPAAKYAEIRDIYLRHVQREKIDLKAIEAELGRPLGNEKKNYEVLNGVAILPIEGVIAKGMSLLTQISGGTSNSLLARDFKIALEDPKVRAILFLVDSPGGTVTGTQELMNLIYESRGTKPVAAITDGTMASAAYWIASAADEIYITGDTTSVGSIGIVASHTDISREQEQMGIKTTEITGGKYKRIASEYAPLSDEGRAYIQAMVDDLYTVFINDMARNRGFAAAKLTDLDSWAEGRIFIGKNAIEAGLVDGVSTIDALIQSLADGATAQDRLANQSSAKTGGAPVEAEQEGFMTADELKAKDPALYQSIYAKGEEEGKEKGKEEGKKEAEEEGKKAGAKKAKGAKADQQDGDGGPMCKGCACADCDETDADACDACDDNPEGKGARAECGRIKGVLGQTIPGHEALIEKLAFDGKTTGPEAAQKVLAAAKENYLAEGKSILIPASPSSADAGAGQDFESLVSAYETANKCSRGEAIKAMAKAQPKAHEEYIKKVNKR